MPLSRVYILTSDGRRGRYGLLFLEGHADFYQPEAEPNGEAASMDLALAHRSRPAVVTDIEGRCPLVRDEDVVVFGRRRCRRRRGDYRIQDGLSWDELAAVLRAFVSSGRAVGINVTIFNPKLDGDGSIARLFTEAFARGLKP